MKIQDNFEVWVQSPFTQCAYLEDLDDKGIEYWSGYSRWPFLAAIYLSMGLNPDAKAKRSGKMKVSEPTNAELERGKEFSDRIKIAYKACLQNKLIVDKIPGHNEVTGQFVDREVDVETFIIWARKSFSANCEALYEQTLKSYVRISHSKLGGNKGNKADDVKLLITKKALQELEADCKCQHSELAEYLEYMKRRDGSLVFINPTYKNKPSIKPKRWPDHVMEATAVAFKEMGIPLLTETKTEPRGRALCERHRNWKP